MCCKPVMSCLFSYCIQDAIQEELELAKAVGKEAGGAMKAPSAASVPAKKRRTNGGGGAVRPQAEEDDDEDEQDGEFEQEGTGDGDVDVDAAMSMLQSAKQARQAKKLAKKQQQALKRKNKSSKTNDNKYLTNIPPDGQEADEQEATEGQEGGNQGSTVAAGKKAQGTKGLIEAEEWLPKISTKTVPPESRTKHCLDDFLCALSFAKRNLQAAVSEDEAARTKRFLVSLFLELAWNASVAINGKNFTVYSTFREEAQKVFYAAHQKLVVGKKQYDPLQLAHDLLAMVKTPVQQDTLHVVGLHGLRFYSSMLLLPLLLLLLLPSLHCPCCCYCETTCLAMLQHAW